MHSWDLVKKDDNLAEYSKEDLDVLSECYFMVAVHFRDDDRVRAWFLAKSPMLGDLSPLEMFRKGKVKKLKEFIKLCIG